jgi:hypothetical protein
MLEGFKKIFWCARFLLHLRMAPLMARNRLECWELFQDVEVRESLMPMSFRNQQSSSKDWKQDSAKDTGREGIVLFVFNAVLFLIKKKCFFSNFLGCFSIFFIDAFVIWDF